MIYFTGDQKSRELNIGETHIFSKLHWRDFKTGQTVWASMINFRSQFWREENDVIGSKPAGRSYRTAVRGFRAAGGGFRAAGWGFRAAGGDFGAAGGSFRVAGGSFRAAGRGFVKGRDRASATTFVAPQMWFISVKNSDMKLSWRCCLADQGGEILHMADRIGLWSV